MTSAPTLEFRHPPGSFRPFASCRTRSRPWPGGAAPHAGAVAGVPGTRAAGRRTVRFAKWGQNPMNRETWRAVAPCPSPARGAGKAG